MEHISGGVCAAKGFQAGGIHCGIRKNRGKRDISMIISEVPASAAAVYTSNLVKGAPIYVTQRNLAGGIAQLAICNSGNANTCNADGEDVAWQMCELAGKAAGIDPHHVIVASTGVIGQPLSIEPIVQHMGALYAAVKVNGSQEAAEGIMTTDTRLKEVAVSFVVDGKVCHLGGGVHAAVAGSDPHLAGARGLRQLGQKRVLAPTGTQKKNVNLAVTH